MRRLKRPTPTCLCRSALQSATPRGGLFWLSRQSLCVHSGTYVK